MCGIAFVWQRKAGEPTEELETEIHDKLCARGPDHFECRKISLCGLAEMRFYASVLHLRGESTFRQPVEDCHGNVLCWNGEIFAGLQLDQVDSAGLNDTKKLSEELERAVAMGPDQSRSAIVQVLQQVQGPFAFVYFHRSANRLYFGHDRFGRRSLLFHCGSENETPFNMQESLQHKWRLQSENGSLWLSSVAITKVSNSFDEVPCVGFYAVDLPRVEHILPAQELELDVHLFPWRKLDPLVCDAFFSDQFNCGISSVLQPANDESVRSVISTASDSMQKTADMLLVVLSNSVGRRVRTIPELSSKGGAARVGVMFSGGLDSVVLAALSHFHAPNGETIDLLNVCFDEAHDYQSPDRLAALIAFKELQLLFPARMWRLICVNVPTKELNAHLPVIKQLLAPCDTQMDLNIASAFWFLARGQGHALSEVATDGSDGIDLNCVFKQNAVFKTAIEQELGSFVLWPSGDQAVSLSSGKAATCPVVKCKRKMKAMCAFGVCQACCFRIQQCVLALRTLAAEDMTRQQLGQMGLSLGAVDQLAQFARRSACHLSSSVQIMCRVHRSRLHHQDSTELTDKRDSTLVVPQPHGKSPTTSSCARVLLVGIGADEQLGGYGRHKTAFLHGGNEALRRELQMDMERIWKRNLGRDDRVISSHGREARFPFLDEQVVSFLTATCDLKDICDLSQPRGLGDKLVLRLVAHRLGLKFCSKLAKRAIQFGTRIAKVTNGQRCTSNRKAKGTAKLD